jgi:hypothetical protein
VRHYAAAPRRAEVAVLLASMRKHCGDFRLHVLCWDFEPWGTPGIPAGDDVKFTPRMVFLARHPEFAPECLPGPPRRVVDQVATARWKFLEDVMRATGEPCTVIDGDQWFMSSPEPVFAEIGAEPMAVSPHRIPPAAAGLPGVTLETHARYGTYNNGWTHVADPDIARELAFLNWQWSYTEVVPRPGRRPLFGDQAHTEDVAERVGAHVIAAPVNIGPWSAHAAPLARGMYSDEVFYGGRPIVSYHFSSLRFNPDGRLRQYADPAYEVERAPGAVELLYRPYLLEVARAGR